MIDKLFGLRAALKNELLGADYVEHGIVEETFSNHSYGKKVDEVDPSCLELSPKLKKTAQSIRQRKYSRNISALSLLLGPQPPFSVSTLKSRSDTVFEEEELTQLDTACTALVDGNSTLNQLHGGCDDADLLSSYSAWPIILYCFISTKSPPR